jgi:peptidoglycan/LPS O-acetylase OafA/YrhL
MIVTFAVLLCLILAIRCATWYWGLHEIAQRSTHARIDSLLFGVIFTALLQFYPRYFDWIASRKGLLISIWISAMAFIAYPHHLLLYRHSGAIGNFVAYRVPVKIGVYLYGIYLWHLAVREQCFRFASHFDPPVRWPLAMTLQYVSAIVLGAILTHLIEWPALRIRDGLFPAKDRLHSLSLPQPASLTAEPSA